MILYNLRKTDDGYRIAKFDDDFNVAGVYNLRSGLGGLSCDCPAGHRPNCKHRKMVLTFAKGGYIDTDWFYCYETGSWHMPLADGLAAPASPEPKLPEPTVVKPMRRI